MIRLASSDILSSLVSFGREYVNWPQARALIPSLERLVLRFPVIFIYTKQIVSAAEAAEGEWSAKVLLEPVRVLFTAPPSIYPLDTRKLTAEERYDWYFMPRTLRVQCNVEHGVMQVHLREYKGITGANEWTLARTGGNSIEISAQPGLAYSDLGGGLWASALLAAPMFLDQELTVEHVGMVEDEVYVLWLEGELVYRPGYWR